MKQMLLGFLSALCLVTLLFGVYQTVSWKHWVEKEGWYLKEPAVQLPNGKAVTRKELLDLIISERLAAAAKK